MLSKSKETMNSSCVSTTWTCPTEPATKTSTNTKSKGNNIFYSLLNCYRIVAFIPSNETQQKEFDDYVEYFQSKERVNPSFVNLDISFLDGHGVP